MPETVPPDRDEMVRLTSLVAADLGQLEVLDAQLGALHEAKRVVHERLMDRKARLRSMQSAHYAGLAREAGAEVPA